ncbi:MAG: glycosyltransferase family 4 protein [Desulfuromonadaceae bacterium]
MKILHLSTNDISGGAARAACRLHHGLQESGVDSQMLVQTKYSDDSSVTGSITQTGRLAAQFKYLVDSMPAIFSRCSRGATFSPAIFPDLLARHATAIAPDIIHLHWIAGGFMRIETVPNLNRPIVWTLHDMWPFTGGCHYSGECDRYTGSCGCCPELRNTIENDLSRRVWQRKAKAWRGVPITVITPSLWMAECAAASSLFSEADIRIIPNGINTTLFHPGDRSIARKILGLPLDRRLILFGAMSPTGDPRKGFQHLLPAIKDLANNGWGESAELLMYGETLSGKVPDFGMKVRSMGQVSDDTLVLLNAAADVLVAPSIQDNLPNTVMESMACGTPVVAFKIGGMPDIIEHGETGWLAHPFDHKDLAQGIVHVIENASRREEMGRRAREKIVREYADNIVARFHIDLYEELMGWN